jgi:ABC-type spermidine/putrescine transport system permease subunit I
VSRSSHFWPWLLSAPAVVLWLMLFVVPLVLLVRVSVYASAPDGGGFYIPNTCSAHAYVELIGEPFGLGIVGFTVGLGVAVAVLSVMIGYPLAVFVHSLPPRAKTIALVAVLLPKLANVFVVLYGVNMLLGYSGPLNRLLLMLGATAEPVQFTHSLFGVIAGEVYLLVPYVVLVIVPAFDRIDPAVLAAARGLGAGPLRAFWRITLPLTLPRVAVAAQVCVVWALGSFLGPIMLGGPEQTTLAVKVQRDGLEYGDWPRAAAAAVVSLLMVAGCLAAFAWPAHQLRKAGATHA